MSDVVRLTIVGSAPEAEVVCGLLRTEGIPATHRMTDLGAGVMDGFPGSTWREVLVSEDDLDEARAILAAQARDD